MKINDDQHVTKDGKVKKNPVKDDAKLRAELANFTGTEGYHYLSFMKRLKSTDGVAYLAEKAQAYWLIDVIESHYPTVKDKDFIVATLTRLGKSKAVFEMKEDTDAPVLVRQNIPYTDFPLSSIKFYIVNGVLMLPSEY